MGTIQDKDRGLWDDDVVVEKLGDCEYCTEEVHSNSSYIINEGACVICGTLVCPKCSIQKYNSDGIFCSVTCLLNDQSSCAVM